MKKANGLEALLRGKRKGKGGKAAKEPTEMTQSLLGSFLDDFEDEDEDEFLEDRADFSAQLPREPSNEMIDIFLRRRF